MKWLGRAGGEYRPVAESGLIDLGPDELARRNRLALTATRPTITGPTGHRAPARQPRPLELIATGDCERVARVVSSFESPVFM